MALLRALALITLPIFVHGQNCVGTLVGVPLHPPAEGAKARGAALMSLGSAAVVDPLSPENLIIPIAEAVCELDSRLGLAVTQSDLRHPCSYAVLRHSSGDLSVLVGGGADKSSSIVPATSAALSSRTFVATETNGNLVVADGAVIRRLVADSGQLELIAGSLALGPGSSLDGASAAGSPIHSVTCLYVSHDTGDIFFCDGPSVVRRIPAPGRPLAGTLQTVAGNGSSCLSVDGVLATTTGYSDLRDVFVTNQGDVLLAENDDGGWRASGLSGGPPIGILSPALPRIVRVSAIDGFSRIIAGGASRPAYSDGNYLRNHPPALGAPLIAAFAVFAVSTTGDIYFSDGLFIVAIVRGSDGGDILVPAAGRVIYDFLPVADGTPSHLATLFSVRGLREGRSPDEAILVDTNASVVFRMNLSTRLLTTVAGAVHVFITPESTDGAVASAQHISGPYDAALDPNTGDVFVAATADNVVVRIFAENGTLSIAAGTGGLEGCSSVVYAPDATKVPIAYPYGLTLDGHKGLVFSEHRCCLIRRLDLDSGALSLLAGSLDYFCNGPLDPNEPPLPGLTDAPVLSLNETCFTAINRATGDIYWTEFQGFRVLVLRNGSGEPRRVAGSGNKGKDADGVVVPGSPALFTDLAAPLSITIDPSGYPVFVDGYFPGRILRLLPNGTLDVVAALKRAPSNVSPIIDGPLSGANAVGLRGLAFVDGGSALLVGDTAIDNSWSIVRRIDFKENAIARIAGSFDGSSEDSHSLLSTRFAYIPSLSVYPGGGLLIVDGTANLVRAGIISAPSCPFCPAGYNCPCGRPIPCSDPATYCPANRLQPISVMRGYYSIAIQSNTTSTPLYFAQAACPRGSYCVGGMRLPCPRGSYGVSRMLTDASGCLRCPAGTYGGDKGGNDASNCLPCPLGSFSESSGYSQCTLCPLGTTTFRTGSNSSKSCSSCRSAHGTDCTSSNVTASLQCSSSTNRFYSLGGPFACQEIPFDEAVLAWDSFLHLFVPRYKWGQTPVPSSAFSISRAQLVADTASLAALVLVVMATVPLIALLLRLPPGCLRPVQTIDMYSRLHVVREGHSPIKYKTVFGGSCSILAIGALIALSTLLISNYYNIYDVSSAPIHSPVTTSYAQLSSAVSRDVPVSFFADRRRPVSGLSLAIIAQGPHCKTIGVNATNFLPTGTADGLFALSSVYDDVSGASYHVLECPACAPLPVSYIDLHLDVACQGLLITAWAVGADGSVQAASYVHSANGSAYDSAIAVSFYTTLQIITAQGVATRGFQIYPNNELVPLNPDPTSILVHVTFPLAPYYVSSQVYQGQTLSQLLSSLIGLLGVIQLFGQAKYFVELSRQKVGVFSQRIQVPPKIVHTPHASGTDSSELALSYSAGADSFSRKPGAHLASTAAFSSTDSAPTLADDRAAWANREFSAKLQFSKV